jgi:hypothetical protein
LTRLRLHRSGLPGLLGERSQREWEYRSELFSLLLKEYQQQAIEKSSVRDNPEVAMIMLPHWINVS